MASETTKKEIGLQLKRRFKADRRKVFKAWTDPEALKQWFGLPGHETTVVEMDLRQGGHYRLGMKKLPDGDVFYNHGIFREVHPPMRLVYTWAWEGTDTHAGETVVTVEFLEQGDETEIVLEHKFFTTTNERDQHNKGWQGGLDRLAEFVARSEQNIHREARR